MMREREREREVLVFFEEKRERDFEGKARRSGRGVRGKMGERSKVY